MKHHRSDRMNQHEAAHVEAQRNHKTSRADIFHHRGPVSESGLDIRYTLDLTKIALNPNPLTLEVVQRLTGVELDDLIEELEDIRAVWEGGPGEVFAAWFGACCEPGQGYQATVRGLYSSLKRWYEREAVDDSCLTPSRKALSQWLSRRGYPRRRPGGVSTFYGFRLVG